MLPSSPSNGAGTVATSTPATSKTTRATIALHIPPVNKQVSHKPLYISSNTQAFGVFAEPYPSVAPSIGPSSTPPPGMQLIPVATPSPCTAASNGGYTCTLTVTAPIGTDLFVVAAFAQASPNPSQAPLSVFVSGPITVSLSPAPGASPLAFTLNGVVASVAVNVASPDPGNTPNTQVFTVGVPTSAPIAIAALDTNGNPVLSAATLPYFNPIVVQASPASDGVTLSLIGTSVCGSSASGATATINCAGDLGNVQVSYDGTPRPDANDHLIDSFSVYSTAAPSPSPANFVLAGNIISTTANAGAYVGSPGYLRRLSSGALAYMVYLESPINGLVTGTFNPSNGTVGTQTTVGVSLLPPHNLAFLPDGSYWMVDTSGNVDCYQSLVATSPTISGQGFTESYDGAPLNGLSVASDGNGDVWYTGWDYGYAGGGPPAPPGFAGFFTSSSCATPSSTVAQFTLNNGYGDGNQNSGSQYLYLGANDSNGAAIVSASIYLLDNPTNYQGVWTINTNTAPGTVSGGQTLNHLSYGNAAALDDASNAYASFVGGSNPDDIERMPAGTQTLSEVLNLPPSTSGSYPNPSPAPALYVFSPNGGAADRAMYVEQDYQALALVESLQTTALPVLVSIPNSVYLLDAAYSSKGGEYVLDMDANSNLDVTRILPTTTWTVANLAMNTGCASSALLTILERGDSGPFTISAGGGVTVTPVPGADHDFWLTSVTSGSPFTVQVTDAHGRSETYTATGTTSYLTCGAVHRRLKAH